MIKLALRTVALSLLVPMTAQAQFWEMAKPGSFPSARSEHAMAYDAKAGKTLLFGGYDGSSLLGDTWEWDGKDWKQLAPATSPSARAGARMAWDAAQGQVVLFGGTDKVGRSRETWLWDGKSWTLAKPKLSPPAGTVTSMAADPLRQSILFVVFDKTCETWEWDGKEWAHLTPTVSAPSMTTHQIAWDPVRKSILLLGQSSPISWTWEWDGKTWTQLHPLTQPPMLDSFGVISDDQRGVIHLVGKTAKGTNQESWEWNGNDWRQVQTSGAPGKRWSDIVAWDSGRSRIVLFSGDLLYHDTWELPLPAQGIQVLGSGCQGSNLKTPTLAGHGDPRPGGVVYWKIEKAIPLMPLAFVFGFDQVNLDLKVFGAPGCILRANTHSLIPGRADLNGVWRTMGVTLPMNPALVGGRYWTQVLAFDPKANALGLTLTNALETTVGY